jgi:hypothetical protein
MNALLIVFATAVSLNCSGESNAATTAGMTGGSTRMDAPECEDTEIRLAALSALQNLKSDKFIPTLKKLYERRDSCSTVMRRRALQYLQGFETEDGDNHQAELQPIVIAAATGDPDSEVRTGAINLLMQDTSEAAATALGKALVAATDQEVQQNALQAIANRREPGIRKSIRDFAILPSVSEEMRGQAIQILSNVYEPEPPQNDRHMERYTAQKAAAKTSMKESAGFLREIYAKLETEALKQQVIAAVSQYGGAENMTWVAGLITGTDQLETRRSALTYAVGANYGYGQVEGGKEPTGPLGVQRATPAELVAAYDKIKERSLKQELVGFFGGSKDDAAFKKLVAVAKTDKDSQIRQYAIQALSGSPHSGAKEALSELVTEE